jgi:hypothetical protein
VARAPAAGRVPASVAAVYVSAEDSRSDVILAAATTLFGWFAVSILAQLPLYPRRGLLPLLLQLVWVFVLTGLVPLLLAKHRGDRAAAFGLDAPRAAWRTGLVLALPVVALGVLRQLVLARDLDLDTLTGALFGRIGGARLASPAIADGTGLFGLATFLQAALFLALTAGALLLVPFLTVRGRDAFRSPDVSLTELLRTFGVGAAGVALVLGLLRSFVAASPVTVLLQVGTLVAVVLLADRLVPGGPSGPTTTRAAVLTPVVVVVVAHVLASGGIFRGDLLTGLYTGALGAGMAAVIAVMVETRVRAWAMVPLVVALHWWPSCLSPLTLDVQAAFC